MGTQPRDALNRLIAAFENHFDVAQAGDLIDSQVLEQAEERLSDAFFTYDDVLFTQYGVELPFDLLDDEIDDMDEDDLVEDEDQDLDEDDEDNDDIDLDDIDDIDVD